MSTFIPPLVSVIIPTRNRAETLGRALDSVFTQEDLGRLFTVEVIVIDDGSTDGTDRIVRSYPTVRYVRLERHAGAAAARNVGLKASSGQYIAFLDDDDLWLPQKLRFQLPVLENHKEVSVVYSQAVILRDDEPAVLTHSTTPAPSGFVFQTLLTQGCFCPHPAMLLFRSSVFRDVGLFDERLRATEDFDLYLRVAYRYPFQFVPGAVSVYHASPHGLYFRQVMLGRAEQDGFTVIQKALQRLPKTRAHEKPRREVLWRTKATSALRKTMFASREDKWQAALTVLESFPEALRYRWGREIATNVVPLIVASDTPIEAGQRWSRRLRAVAGRGTLARWFWMRVAIGAIWAQTAVELECGPNANSRAARAAAALAILHNPAKLRLRALHRLILGGASAPDPTRGGSGRRVQL